MAVRANVHELEAKFLTDDGGSPVDVLRRLQRDLTLAGCRIEARGRSAFTDHYFDTADQRLRAAGWSYREREDARGRRAALKEITRSRAAIFDREEIEQPIEPGETPTTLRPGPVRERLSNLLHPEAEVVPLFRIDSERAAYTLEHPDHPRGLVQMAFDQARVQARDPLEFQELALELKSGPHELLALVLDAVEREPSLIEARLSQFERGLAATGTLERRRGLEPKPLDRRARWLDLALVQLRDELQRIRLYEPFAWEGLLPESIHRLYRALRRTRAALRTFATALPTREIEGIAARLRWIGTIVRRVDELNAHIIHLDGYPGGNDPSHRTALDRYRRHLRHLARAAQRELRAALAEPGYADLVAALQRLIADAARPEHAAPARIDEMAAAAFTPLLGRVRQRFGTLSGEADQAVLSGLHDDAIRLLDRLEFLEPTYPLELARTLPLLREMVEHLRAHQRAARARALMQRYRDVHATRPQHRALFNHLMRLEERRAERHRQRLVADRARFDGAAAELLGRFA